MNRELRRAQKKADEKQERDRARAKAARQEKRQRRRAKPKKKADPRPVNENATPEQRKRLPGRFSSLLTLFVTAFILLQAVTPILAQMSGGAAPEPQIFQLVVEVLYYALFGYFACLWLMRSGFQQALYIAMGTGIGLAVVSVAAQFIAQFYYPNLVPNFALLYAGIPAVILGAYLGRLVYQRAP